MVFTVFLEQFQLTFKAYFPNKGIWIHCVQGIIIFNTSLTFKLINCMNCFTEIQKPVCIVKHLLSLMYNLHYIYWNRKIPINPKNLIQQFIVETIKVTSVILRSCFSEHMANLNINYSTCSTSNRLSYSKTSREFAPLWF